jgi:hypothetical protein
MKLSEIIFIIVVAVIAGAGFGFLGQKIGYDKGYETGFNDGMYVFCLEAPNDEGDFEFDPSECTDLLHQMQDTKVQLTPIPYHESR